MASNPEHWGPNTVLREELLLRRPKPATLLLEAPEPPSLTERVWMAAVNFVQSFRPVDEMPLKPDPITEETYRDLNKADLIALCLSGGGIRSASIGLGILQALAQQNRLSCLDYLSTVSGGGYIGSWLSAWCARAGQNIHTVQSQLQREYRPLDDEYEADEVRALRDFTSYLTPQNGLLSSDTWAGVATVLRNLALNWLLFLPLFLLLVWLPKASVFVFDELAWKLPREALDVLPALFGGSWSVLLLALAAACYAVAQTFASGQLAIQDEQGGPLRKPEPYGAGQVDVVFFNLIPTYLAACLASIVLWHWLDAGKGTVQPGPAGWWSFAAAGAFLWGAPHLYFSLRVGFAAQPERPPTEILWHIFTQSLARFGAGAGMGLALLLGFILLRDVDPAGGSRYCVAFGLPCCFLAHLAGTTLFVALTSRIRDHDAVREWSARAGGLFALAAVGWLFYAALILWDPLKDWPGPFTQDQIAGVPGKLVHAIIAALGGAAGIAGALLGRSPSTGGDAEPAKGSGLNTTRIAQLAGIVFFVVILFELSRLFDLLAAEDTVQERLGHGALFFTAVLAGLAAWTSIASYFINVNKFSLHAFYRNRLIRAYLGASNRNRRPSAFTGFDEGDNMRMAQLREPRAAPIHVVNMALNLVHGQRLAWQERKASSFSATRHAVGNPHLGYRPSGEYGAQITLGTAMAISGAAVSPSMGYHSSPLLGLLMTLFNVRLGWWLGNPAGAAWHHPGPLQSVGPFLMEVLGLTDDRRRYVYLSDGGHFENLGIYEMVRRRCRTIIAVDAGADPDFKFEDLGNAIRKARIDLGVEICFDPPRPAGKDAASKPTRLRLVNRPESPTSLPYCAIGTITYPETGSTGQLIYIKAAIHGDEPEDIGSYAAANPTFPHESTADQFFTESQFESYRRLGLHIGLSVFPVARADTEACVATEFAEVAARATEAAGANP